MFLHSRHCLGHELADDVWDLARILVEHVENVWTEPDEGIWEVRGPRRHFVHSKVMAWVAVDRWVQLCEAGRPDEPMSSAGDDLRDDMHREICDKGYNASVGAFTQYYGSTELDASCLMLALVGFLPPSDPRIVGTVEAIQRDLVVDGFVKRYHTSPVHQDDGQSVTVDGLPPGEGAFLLTTFWLADNLILQGRVDEGRAIFDRIAGLDERSRPAVRGVRRRAQSNGRQLPASLLARRPHRDGDEPDATARTARQRTGVRRSSSACA